MDRLTERDKKTGVAYFPKCFDGCDGVCKKCNHETDHCETLAAYEDTGLTPEQIQAIDKEFARLSKELGKYKEAEEQGLLMRLPCKIGDTIYEVIEETVPNHYYYIGSYEVQDISAKAICYANDWVPLDYNNPYFTLEDAEKALAEMEERS